MRDVTYIAHSDSLEHAGFKYIKKYKNSKGNTVYVYDDAQGHQKLSALKRMSDQTTEYAKKARNEEARANDRDSYHATRTRGEMDSLSKIAMDSYTNKIGKSYRAETRAREQRIAYDKGLSSKSFSNTVIDPVKDKVSSIAKSITTPIKNTVDDALWKLDDVAFDVKLWLKYDAEDVIPDAVDSAKKGISSASKKAKALLDKGKSALSKVFGTNKKTTYGQEAVAEYARGNGLIGEKVEPYNVPKNPSNAARTRISQRNTFAKRAARTGPTEPERKNRW